MSKVIVTGADGYCGWPVVLKLLKKGHSVLGIDNRGRRNWVKEVDSISAVPILDPIARAEKVHEKISEHYEYIDLDLNDFEYVDYTIKSFKPDVILHLAAQPSAPYSQIDIEHCNFTQNNNMESTRNLLWSLHKNNMFTHFVMTTTTGIYGAPKFPIPEGDLYIKEHDERVPYPAMAGSWYHMSHAYNAGNLWLAAKQFSFPITELRTSIVCGCCTEETKDDPDFKTRFDFDYYFGVVTNRFLVQAMVGRPITVYGKGLQMKPMISLEDMARTTANCVDYWKKGQTREKYLIYNQLEQPVSIVDIAETIKTTCEEKFNHPVEIKHIENPRIEDEEHFMEMENRRFILDLANGQMHCTVITAIEKMCEELYPHIERFKDYVRK